MAVGGMVVGVGVVVGCGVTRKIGRILMTRYCIASPLSLIEMKHARATGETSL